MTKRTRPIGPPIPAPATNLRGRKLQPGPSRVKVAQQARGTGTDGGGELHLQRPCGRVDPGSAAHAVRVAFGVQTRKNGALEARQVPDDLIPHGPPRAVTVRSRLRATTGCGAGKHRWSAACSTSRRGSA